MRKYIVEIDNEGGESIEAELCGIWAVLELFGCPVVRVTHLSFDEDETKQTKTQQTQQT